MVRERWRPSTSDLELIVELVSAKVSIAEIAAQLGVNEMALKLWLNQTAAARDPAWEEDMALARRLGYR